MLFILLIYILIVVVFIILGIVLYKLFKINKKVFITIVGILFYICLLFFNHFNIKFEDLQGNIVSGEYSRDEESKELYYNFSVLNFSLQKKKVFAIRKNTNHYSFANNSKNLIYSEDSNIYLYDIESEKKYLLCKIPYETFHSVKCIDDIHISFYANEKIILRNIETNNEIIIADNVSDNYIKEVYSYSKERKRLYYHISSGEIYEFDLKKWERKYIADGHTPMISQNGNVIAYFHYTEKTGNRLFVKNLDTNEIWKTNKEPEHFKVSPNGEYIIMIQPYNGLKLIFNGREMVIYDYKQNEVMTITDYNSCRESLDWHS